MKDIDGTNAMQRHAWRFQCDTSLLQQKNEKKKYYIVIIHTFIKFI